MIDVFISFKNTDSNGNITEDYYIAKRLYAELQRMGLTVFFSAETLSKKGSSDYYNEINKALMETKALIVVLTKAEYASTRWVQREWQTFDAEYLAGRKAKPLLFTCTKGVNISDVEAPLRNYQNCGFHDNFALLKEYLANAFSLSPTKQEPAKPTITEDPIPHPTTFVEYGRPFESPAFPMTLNPIEDLCADEGEVESTKNAILKTLASSGHKNAVVKNVTFSPTVTSYYVSASSIFSNTLPALERKLNEALAADDSIAVFRTSTGLICIEVPNQTRRTVPLGAMMRDSQYTAEEEPHSLVFPIGVDISNATTYGDLSKTSHILLAGASGTGKSNFLHSFIVSLISKCPPQNLRFMLIDLKKTEFDVYSLLPHLEDRIIGKLDQALHALRYLAEETTRRHNLFAKKREDGYFATDNIDEYNDNLGEGEQKLPRIAVIIDELADLMTSTKKKEVQHLLHSILPKARDAGIHLIFATQTPSSDVITPLIKRFASTRICFALPTQAASRSVLEASGAEKLLGLGDMLLVAPGQKMPVRLQAPYVESVDAKNVVAYIYENNLG